MLLKVIVIVLVLLAWLFIWSLCRIAAISDRRMEEMHRRELNK